MKHKVILPEGEGQQPLSVSAHRTWRMTLLAAVICLLLAFVVWFCVMNASDTDYVCLRVEAPRDGLTYTLSDEGVEVEGPVYALKELNSIGVIIPGHVPGVYTLTAEDLVLPEGVRPVGELQLTLTVSVK